MIQERISISAVITTYNRANTLGRAIDSILSQEYPVSEIVIIDDGSNDDTKNIITKYRGQIKYFYQKNSGVAAARNRGVKESTCNWIAFLDSDDYWLPQHLERIKEVILKTDGNSALYFANILYGDKNNRKDLWESCDFNIIRSHEVNDHPFEWALLKTQPMMLQASVVSRECYLKIDGIPETLVTREDTFLFYKLCLLFSVCAVKGYAGVMTSDCSHIGRLTKNFDSRTETFYECTKIIYLELLKHTEKMQHKHKKVVEQRLVKNFLNYGIFSIKEKKVFKAIKNLIQGALISPSMLANSFQERLTNYHKNLTSN